MTVQILTPDKVLFEGEAQKVTLPGLGGRFQILNNHAPLIAALDKGVITVDKITVEINSGFLEVVNNKLTVLAD